MIRNIFRTISHLIPSKLIVSAIGQKTILPFYHLVSENKPAHVKHLYKIKGLKAFENDLDYFLKHFTPIDSNILIQSIDGKILTKKPSFFLSFDDGFKEVKDMIAPILLRKGIPATFFVNPAYVGNNDMMYRCKVSLIIEKLLTSNYTNSILFEVAKLIGSEGSIESINKSLLTLHHNQVELINRIAKVIDVDFETYLKKEQPYLSLNDLAKLSDSGFTIGSHGFNHPYFNQISDEEQIKEVESSMEWIKDNFPNQPRFFAFPFSDDGISNVFIKKLSCKPENIFDITFGTAGIQKNYSTHFQRIPMEENCLSGKRIVDGEILYYLAKHTIGYHKGYDKDL
ncbi:MAG: polysaccharide deacetylase family protein [Tenuifilaceae bacterium]